MTGGYGSQFDPMTVDSDDYSSEGDTDDCIFTKRPRLASPTQEQVFVNLDDAEDCVCIGSSMKDQIKEAYGDDIDDDEDDDEGDNEDEDEDKDKDDDEDDDGVFVRAPTKVEDSSSPPETSPLSAEQQQILHLVREGKVNESIYLFATESLVNFHV
jgi:hypothetical protein